MLYNTEPRNSSSRPLATTAAAAAADQYCHHSQLLTCMGFMLQCNRFRRRETTMDSTGSEGARFAGLDLQDGAYDSHTLHFGYPEAE